MKKRGSALAIVLIMMSALLILGTAVSAAVVNSTKFNANYSDNIDLELAAKTGVNILREDFFHKVQYSKELKGIDEINRYVENKSYMNSSQVINIIDDYKNNKDIIISLDMLINKVSDQYEVDIIAIANEVGKNATKQDKQTIKLNLKEEEAKVDMDKFTDILLNNSFALLQFEEKEEYFNIISGSFNSSTAEVYIQPFKENVNGLNNKYVIGNKMILGPNLKFNYGQYYSSKYGGIRELANKSASGQEIKDKDNNKVIGKAIDIEDNSGRVIGSAIDLGTYKIVLINGDLILDKLNDAPYKTIIYATGKIIMKNVSGTPTFNASYSSLTSREGISIESGSLALYYKPNDSTEHRISLSEQEKFKEVLKKYAVE